MPTHTTKHPLAGQTVRIKKDVTHPQIPNFGGSEFRIEDWWDHLTGKSWGSCDGNPACLLYAIRSSFQKARDIPEDDEVIYGKVGWAGHLLHVSELELPTSTE